MPPPHLGERGRPARNSHDGGGIGGTPKKRLLFLRRVFVLLLPAIACAAGPQKVIGGGSYTDLADFEQFAARASHGTW